MVLVKPNGIEPSTGGPDNQDGGRFDPMTLDTQVVEVLGRQRLMAELLRDGLEVAVPARDRGVDLIAYVDLSQQVACFTARPRARAPRRRSSSMRRRAFDERRLQILRQYLAIED